jgi:hypothetical protein
MEKLIFKGRKGTGILFGRSGGLRAERWVTASVHAFDEEERCKGKTV